MSGTAKIYPATLTPSKQELLSAWVPKQPWFDGDPADIRLIARYRFVDPDGEVGIETHVIGSAGVSYHVPTTWRAEPLEGAEEFLIGELEHSVLGHRYCYDAPGDPVYAAELFRVIHEGDTEADLSRGEKNMTVAGSGIVRVSNAAGEAVRLIRILDGEHVPAPPVLGTLTGAWSDGDVSHTDVVLAVIR
ncbi:CG0192-related protein [Propionicicella superfundia]|uniref:CG0192-related protein n=1 Tax=Propionicicella superfundia TaxID=348582 RepID=UPI000428675A|nr:hypothetical protein [Propionicicella superfundia]